MKPYACRLQYVKPCMILNAESRPLTSNKSNSYAAKKQLRSMQQWELEWRINLSPRSESHRCNTQQYHLAPRELLVMLPTRQQWQRGVRMEARWEVVDMQAPLHSACRLVHWVTSCAKHEIQMDAHNQVAKSSMESRSTHNHKVQCSECIHYTCQAVKHLPEHP